MLNTDTIDSTVATLAALFSSACNTTTSLEDLIDSAAVPSVCVVPCLEDEAVALWPLANGGVTRISRTDEELVAPHAWRSVNIHGHVYACTRINGSRVYMHRHLCGYSSWDRAKRKWVANQVDHADGDGLNNTRGNLRSCDHRRNQQNSVGHPSLRKSRFKGVAYYKNLAAKPWRATITVDGRQVNGGYFHSESDAARCYDTMAVKYFGDYTRPNYA
jgi:hypothetical protein